MTATVTQLRPASPSLSREQKALVRSVPGLVELVAREVCWKHGGDPRDPDRLHLGHLGVYQAALTYDPDRSTFYQWAYYKAASAMMDGLRRDRRQRKMLSAARAAGFLYLATKGNRLEEEESFDDTTESLVGQLAGFAGEQLVASLVGAAVQAEKAEGEDELMEREAWAKALQALRKMLGDLREDQRELLEVYATGHELKRIAKGRGVSYWMMREEFHALIALARARLRGLGLKSVPAAVADGWEPVLSAAPPERAG